MGENQSKEKLPKEFIEKLKAVKAKRARTVIDHILNHGYITTQELSQKYGYDHPPRAARDVREQGIPLETFRVTGTHRRKIGAYRFGDPSKMRRGKLGGRKAWPKNFKQRLVDFYGSRCAICFTKYETRYLQIDHRVPYEVGGDAQGELSLSDYMLVCSSCNRAKSWSCEHCKNCKEDRMADICETCYWANPDAYAHIALRLIRRLDVTWTGDEVPEFDKLLKLSEHACKDLPEFVKDVLRDALADEQE